MAKISSYNDGIVTFYEEIEKTSSFNAKLNPKNMDDFNFIAKLAYSESTKRTQDLDYAMSLGRDLTIKIKCRLVKLIEQKHKAVICGDLFDIINIDYDTKNREMYIFLTEVKKKFA